MPQSSVARIIHGCQDQRFLRGWTVTELAKKAGVSRTSATEADQGRPVGLAVYSAILAAFEAELPSSVARALLPGMPG